MPTVRSRRDLRRLAQLGAAGLLAVLGQLSFRESPPYVLDGVLLYALAALLFHRAARRPERAGDRPAGLALELGRRPLRYAALALTLVLVGWLLILRARPHSSQDYGLDWALWLGSIFFALASFGVFQRRTGERPAGETGWPWRRRLSPWLLGLFGLALALRGWRLGSVPWTLSGDEGSFGVDTAQALAGTIRDPFTTGWLATPTLSFFFGAPFLWLFGQDSFGLRFPWMILGTLTVVLAYFLVKRLQGPLVALLTAVFLATWGFHIHFSRLSLAFSAGGFLAALGLLLLQRALATGSMRCWTAAGAVAGSGLYVYAGGRLVPVLLGGVALARLVGSAERWRRHRQGLAGMIVVALVVAAPMLQYAVVHNDDFNARINMVGIFETGWLKQEMALHERSAAAILADQLQRSVLAFTLYPDRNSHYGSTAPLLGFTAGVFFLIGLGYCTMSGLRARMFPMVSWWWAGLAGSVLTTFPPESQRLSILAVPSAFFLAVAIAKSFRLAAAAWRRPRARRWAAAAALALTAMLGASSAWAYFTSYSRSFVYGNPNAVVATRLARYAQHHFAAGTRVVFFGSPRMYVGFGSIPYLAPHLRAEDINQPLRAPLPTELGCSEIGSAFVFLPERFQEFDHVEPTFPGGKLTPVPSPSSGETLFYLYEIRRPCAASGAAPA